ncbi:MAG: hypothetical protein M3Y74_05360 [Chloroflexota bacterium]|nr:hypothetical protein [Chloroflexota bacterium]
MSVSQSTSVATILRDHVTLEIESIDRMYLNVYVPLLQRAQGVVRFFRQQRGATFASSALMEPISSAFVAALERYARTHGVPLLTFAKGQRKDDVAAAHLAAFHGREGVLFIGKAQEKAHVFRTEKRRNPQTGQPYPWIVPSTALVNHYYIYAVDADFGPFFLKFCSYFPYTAKLCLNGHEYLKRQLSQEEIAFEALDNGLLSCADPARAQVIADELCAPLIDGLLRKWLARLPHPFTAEDRAAGYRYDVSILQAEFALTQVLDRPVTGRVLFEEVIRENLDLGRPDHVQLIFDRRVTTRTPGRFRTRVITQGVTPSLYVDDKKTRIKQYHKEGRALRTETTINNTRDFAIGKRLHNLPAARAVGFAANRRLLDVQTLSHDGLLGDDAFQQVTRPQVIGDQRVSALPFADPRVQALLSVLVLYCLLPQGFANKDMRAHLAPLLGLDPSAMTPGRMTYDLRRLRLHGLIARIPHTQRYRVTDDGLRTALFFTRVYARILRPGLARIVPAAPPGDLALRPYFDKVEGALDRWIDHAKLAA